MTAYRYVKLGQLYAEKRAGSWVINEQDLKDFQNQAPAAELDTKVDTKMLEDALISGDETRVWRLIEASIASTDDPVSVHLDVLSPALHSIGQRWADGELSIASEHKASAVANRIIARLGSHLTAPGRRRGTVVVGAAPGDVHSIPTAMFADLIRSFGITVIDLGGSPDVDSFIEACQRYPDCVVALSLTGPDHDDAAIETVQAVRTALGDVPIAIGGGAISSEEHARSLGADLWHSDSREAARLISEAAAQRRQAPSL